VLQTGIDRDAPAIAAAIAAAEAARSELVVLSGLGSGRRGALAAARSRGCLILFLPGREIPVYDRWRRWLSTRGQVEVVYVPRPRVDRRTAKKAWEAGVPWWC